MEMVERGQSAPLARYDSYGAGIIQTVLMLLPLLGGGNLLFLRVMTHLFTDMEVKGAQRDFGTCLRICRWKAAETSGEGELCASNPMLSPLSHNGSCFLILFS